MVIVEEEILAGASVLSGVPRWWPNDLKSGIMAEHEEQGLWERNEFSLVHLDQSWEVSKMLSTRAHPTTLRSPQGSPQRYSKLFGSSMNFVGFPHLRLLWVQGRWFQCGQQKGMLGPRYQCARLT